MKRKSLFQRHQPPMLLIMIIMTISALLIYRVVPRPENLINESKQMQSNKCVPVAECTKK